MNNNTDLGRVFPRVLICMLPFALACGGVLRPVSAPTSASAREFVTATPPLPLENPMGSTDDQAAEETEYPEPIAVEETYPNEVGEYAVRISLERDRAEREGEDVAISVLPRAQIFFGIAERLGGEIEFSYLNRNPDGEHATSGIGNLELAAKYLVHEDRERRRALVVGMEVELPTASESKELGEGKVEFAPFLAFLKELRPDRGPRSLLVQGNVGFRHTRHGSDEDNVFYNLSIGVPVDASNNWYLFLESLGSVAVHDDGASPSYLAPGLKYAISEQLFVALGMPIGLNRDASNVQLLLQVQRGF